MTASSELRAAATKLRGTAKGATPGPWVIRPGNNVSSNVADMWNHSLVIDGGGWAGEWNGETKAVVYGAALDADAAWIALASPVIAEPFATALDLLADRWDTFDPHLDAMHQHDETAVGHHLLVIARQINGGGS